MASKIIYYGDFGDTLSAISKDISMVAPGVASVITAIKGTPAASQQIIAYNPAVAAAQTKKLFGIPVGFIVLVGGAALVTGTVILLKKKPKKRR